MRLLLNFTIGLLFAFSVQADRLVINNGAAPNDGTGDSLKTSMTKINANFAEVYSTNGLLQTNKIERLNGRATNLFVNGGTFTGEGSTLTNLSPLNISTPWNSTNSALIGEGDSLMAWSPPTHTNRLFFTLTNNFAGWRTFGFYTNFAVPGDTISGITTRWSANVAPAIADLKSMGLTNIYLLFDIGANNVDTPTATFTDAWSNYVWRAKSSNITVIACTILPQTNSGGTPATATNWFIDNQFIRRSALPDYIVDWARALPYGGLFPDGVHPNSDQFLLAAMLANKTVLGPTHSVDATPVKLFGTTEFVPVPEVAGDVWFTGPVRNLVNDSQNYSPSNVVLKASAANPRSYGVGLFDGGGGLGAFLGFYDLLSSSNRITISSSGKIGINTINPLAQLHLGNNMVGGEPTYRGNLIVDSGVSATDFNGIELKSYTTGNGHGWRLATLYNGSSTASLRFQSRINSATWADRIVFDGETGAASTVQVNGNITADTSNYSPTNLVIAATSDNTRKYGIGIFDGSSGLGAFFAIRDILSAANRLVISSSGQVGIGTDHPLAQLHIGNNLPGSAPSYRGNTIIESGSVNNSSNGIELLSYTNGLGHGWRIATVYNGQSSAALVFQARTNSATWVDKFKIDPETGITTVLNGFASFATNSTMTISSTGATNSTGVNQTAWLTAATGLQLFDNAGTAIWSGTQAIAALTPIPVQPGGKFTGTGITSVGTHAQ